jgi:hypothetical protein
MAVDASVAVIQSHKPRCLWMRKQQVSNWLAKRRSGLAISGSGNPAMSTVRTAPPPLPIIRVGFDLSCASRYGREALLNGDALERDKKRIFVHA